MKLALCESKVIKFKIKSREINFKYYKNKVVQEKSLNIATIKSGN